jgi:formate C-acetyltransferase
VWVASPYLSLLLPLEWVLNQGESALTESRHISLDLGPLEQFTTFESFFNAYQTQLAAYIRHETEGQIAARRGRFERNAYPLLSCFVRDCLARGLDMDQGGARHNWVLPSHVGLANAVDSLAVIRELVYRRKTHTLADIRDLLHDPVRAAERQLLARSITPYGNDCAATDDLAKQVTDFITETYRTLREPVLDSTFHPGYFCWIMHERMGSITGASPDGRPAGAVLADGSGAAQGRDRVGPTAAINSATSWEHSPCLGGIAVNLKFAPDTLRGDAGTDALLALVQSFLAQGGFELQVNVVDSDILRNAQAHPEHYRDLVVRVAGFSEYFTLLSPATQDEVISRTAHEC